MYSQKESRTVQIHTDIFPRFSLQYMNYGCRDTRTQKKNKKIKQEYKKDKRLENQKKILGPISCTFLSKVVRPVNPDVLELSEVLEVQGTVLVIVELKRGVDLDVDRSLLHATK